MSGPSKIDNIDEDIEDISSLFGHKIPFTLRFFIRDLEISKRDFFTLFVILISLVFLLIGQIGLDLMIIGPANANKEYLAWQRFLMGY